MEGERKEVTADITHLFMIVIVSTHGTHCAPELKMYTLEQAAVHLLAKGVSNEKSFLILPRSPFKRFNGIHIAFIADTDSEI